MTPRLTDDQVSGLPLAEARAELLEEIMATSPSDRTGPAPAARSRRPWAAPLAAAAAVALLVATPTYLLSRDGADTPGPADRSTSTGGPAPTSEPAPTVTSEPPTATPTATPSATADVAHEWLVLDAAGWTLTHSSDTDGWHEVQYENGDQRLDVSVVAAQWRDGYVEDRRRIGSGVDPGTPVKLAGADALMWPYSATDHTAIGVAGQGVYPEVRGAGMDLDAYLALLAQLRWTDQAGFEAALPDTSVTSGERGAVVDEMVADVPLPPGWEDPGSPETDRYQLGVDVAGSVACGWIEEFARATREDDTSAADEAAAAMATSRDWAILQEMDAEGDYPEVVWDVGDELAAGEVPEGWRQGLGCG